VATQFQKTETIAQRNAGRQGNYKQIKNKIQ
jgi:hypothetical protein